MKARRGSARSRRPGPRLPACAADDLAERWSRDPVPRTILLMGADEAKQRTALEATLAAIRSQARGDVEVVRGSALASEKGGDGWDVATVFDELHTASLFAAERVIVVHHAGALGKELAERLAERLGRGENAKAYLILSDATADPPESRAPARPAGRGPCALAVACGAASPERRGPGEGAAGGELVAWVRRRARELHREIASDQARGLIHHVGDDRTALDAALQILIARTAEGATVSSRDLAELQRLPRGGDSWSWVDATLSGDLPRALGALRAVFEGGIRFRGEARRRRLEAELGPPLVGALASRLRFVEERGWPRRLDPLALQRVTAILLRADRAVKGGWSTLGAYGALERATIEICRIVQPGAWRLRQGKRS